QRALRAAPVHGGVPHDAAEPVVGLRLQPGGGAAGSRSTGTRRVRDADGGRRAVDERLDRGGGAERAAPARPRPAACLSYVLAPSPRATRYRERSSARQILR